MSQTIFLRLGENDVRADNRQPWLLGGGSPTMAASVELRPLVEYDDGRVLLDIESMLVGRGVAFDLDDKHLVAVKRSSGKIDFYEIPSRR